MGKAVVVEILDGLGGLREELKSNVLGNAVLGMDEEKKRAISGKLLQKVSLFRAEKGVDEGDDVGVVQLPVDLDFVQQKLLVLRAGQVYLFK